MADPAWTGATQLETRPPRLQLLRAARGDEEIAQHPGGGVNPCGGDRWDRRRVEEHRGGPLMEGEEEGSLLRLKKAGLCRPLLVPMLDTRDKLLEERLQF